MARIPSDRVGYSGYTCIGIVPTPVGPMDCNGNRYLRVPGELQGGRSDGGYENLSPLDSDTRLLLLMASCGIDFDPFLGTPVDLYQAFIDDGLGSYIEDDCYNVNPVYGTGFSRGQPMFNLFGTFVQ